MKKQIKQVLDELEKQSNLEKSRIIDVPANDRMLAITKETGEFFNILLRTNNAKNILEIGTSVGYSSIWCAEAIIQNEGKIITIERNEDKIKRARKNFENAGVVDVIEIKKGEAIKILNELTKEYNEFFDFVLIDADKENCMNYFDIVLPMLKKGGLILTDNMLFPEKYRSEMKMYKEHIEKKPNVKTITINIGFGEELTIKI